jgi:hypothetical protein
MPADRWLDSAQNSLKWGIVEQIEQIGYVPEVFFDPSGRKSLASGRAWSATAVEDVMRHCHGAALIGLPRWEFDSADGHVALPSDFCNYEGALAQTLGLPLLIVTQWNLAHRVVFDVGFGPYIGSFPVGADVGWLAAPAFRTCFQYWQNELMQRRDVFLGYCGASSQVARVFRRYLEGSLDASVLDWQRDFKPGRTILEQIEEARLRCTAGVFIFTKDDELNVSSGAASAAPRDNVVFEAGYFASAKGKDRVLVIREDGTKLPADLGGDIYASFADRAKLTNAKKTLRRFIANL